MKVFFDNTKKSTLLRDIEYGQVFMRTDNANGTPIFFMNVNMRKIGNFDRAHAIRLDTGELVPMEYTTEIKVMNAQVNITRK